ncbi:hypothetical protein ACN20G_28250 (plasmid) [Streptomyces sp. BI20]|uniref:hypothetical protein n=1 Tax=Streptomyces sp. BI20 TaxID=3403460 RepID=UPI003C7739BB
MPSGGARARSGPPPDPMALRPNTATGEWITLPPSRTGPVPDWPLTTPSERESELWPPMWARPQAALWERYGQAVEVALYLRALTAAEQRGAPVALLTVVRQMADSLGLTVPGLRANRWKIPAAADEHDALQPAEGPAGRRSKVPPRVSSVRSRLTVIPPPGDGG